VEVKAPLSINPEQTAGFSLGKVEGMISWKKENYFLEKEFNGGNHVTRKNHTK
jgi:hypothetical protein